MPALRPGKARSERVLPAARASTLTLCSLYATLPDPLLSQKRNEEFPDEIKTNDKNKTGGNRNKPREQ